MKTSLGRLTLEKIKALTENSTLAQASKFHENSAMAQASKLYESSAMAQASKLYENSAIAQASKLYENSAMAQASKLYENSAMAQASKLYESSAMAQASKLYESSAMAQASKLYESSAIAQVSNLYENSAIAQASKLYENSAMAQASKLYENSAIAQIAKLVALTTPIEKLLNTQEFFSLNNLLNHTEIGLINSWKSANTVEQLATLAASHSSLGLLAESLSVSTFEETQKESYSIDIIEDTTNISDKNLNDYNLEKPTHINDESLFINTILLSIYILVIHAQVHLDQLLVTLAQNFLNSALFFYLQSKYEVAKNSPNSIDKNEFKNSRITKRNSFIYINPSLKSEIIEELEQYKFLEIIHDPDLHKSWLKVRTEINDEVLEGYVLRSYTSPIK